MSCNRSMAMTVIATKTAINELRLPRNACRPTLKNLCRFDGPPEENAMKTNSPRRFVKVYARMARRSIPIVVAAAILIVFPACQHSNTVTGPPPPASQPPVADLSGRWEGPFESQWTTGLCGFRSPARATFAVAGSEVTGNIEVVGNPCGFANLVLQGTLEMNSQLGGNLTGRISGEPFTDGSATGVVGSESGLLDFMILGLRNGTTAAGGRLTLTRKL